jgi:hypothetical protein
MNELSHKEKLDYWKKYDPIHYSEMTSDPCGHNSSPSWWPVVLLVFSIGILVSIIIITFVELLTGT